MYIATNECADLGSTSVSYRIQSQVQVHKNTGNLAKTIAPYHQLARLRGGASNDAFMTTETEYDSMPKMRNTPQYPALSVEESQGMPLERNFSEESLGSYFGPNSPLMDDAQLEFENAESVYAEKEFCQDETPGPDRTTSGIKMVLKRHHTAFTAMKGFKEGTPVSSLRGRHPRSDAVAKKRIEYADLYASLDPYAPEVIAAAQSTQELSTSISRSTTAMCVKCTGSSAKRNGHQRHRLGSVPCCCSCRVSS
jgi:hypothetical protein